MLNGVENGKFFLQHFWILHDIARVWPAPSQHLTTRSNNVARCCVEMFRAFGRAFALSVKETNSSPRVNPSACFRAHAVIVAAYYLEEGGRDEGI